MAIVGRSVTLVEVELEDCVTGPVDVDVDVVEVRAGEVEEDASCVVTSCETGVVDLELASA